MTTPPIPPDEEQRLVELDQLQLLYTTPEQVFDRITSQLADIFRVPLATMSLIDRDHQFAKSSSGLPEPLHIIPRNLSICGHVVGNNDMLVIEDLAADPRFNDNPLIVQSGLRFYAGAPLRTDSGRPIGSLCIIDTKPRQLSHAEIRLLKLVAEGLMTEVKLRQVSRHLAERNHLIERSMIEARHVQRFLLPPSQQTGPGFAFYHTYHPIDQIGGDFTDMRHRDDGLVLILLADVSGHGPSAALTSAMAKTSFLRSAASATQPQELLTAMNRDLTGLVESGRFITAAAVVFDPSRQTAQLSWAGHPHPLLFRNHDAQLLHLPSDLPLLIDENKTYTQSLSLSLRPGDRLLLYTDGATDVTNPQGAFLDSAGLKSLAATALPLQGLPWLEKIWQSLNAYAQSPLRDDVALACLQVT